ncbi:hypothetical protein GCM10020227_36710 [Streptomyces flavovirens]
MACLVMAAGVALGPATTAAYAHEHAPADGLRAALLVPAAPSPHDSASSSAPADEAPMAGRSAAEGRARPGRSLAPSEAAPTGTPADEVPPEDEPGEAPAYTPPPDAFPEPGRTARERAMSRPAVRHVKQVLLGTGIVLVGLGTGFLAIRMRRAN